MANKIPLFLLTAVALAAAVAYLLQSSERNDDDRENDLQLHDDGSDDVTVQVKNFSSHNANIDADRDADRLVEDEAKVDVTSGGNVVDEMAVVERVGKENTAGVDHSTPVHEEPMDKKESVVPEDAKPLDIITIKQEALSKAATIIQSIPAVSIVDECIQAVAAGAELDISDAEIERDIEEKSAAISNITTIRETETTTTTEEQTEQYVPIKTEPVTPKAKLPKTPPVPLFSPSPQKDEIEAPTDTADYSKLKNYWKHQDDKHTFSPPRSIGSEVLAASPVKPPTEVDSDKANLTRSSSKEDNAASAAVAGLMAAGVVNMLDQVYSPKGQVNSFVDDEEEGMPMVDVSMIDDKSSSNIANVKEGDSEEQLILEGDSPSSGSDKSSSEDYVKIVRTPSGDPISESALLSRPIATTQANEDVKDSIEDRTSDILAESAAVVSKEEIDVEVKSSEPNTNEDTVIEAAGSLPEAEKPQTKSKSKNKKKKKGKKK